MGFNIKNNYGPNIEVNDGGKVTLIQGKNGLWNTASLLGDANDATRSLAFHTQCNWYSLLFLVRIPEVLFTFALTNISDNGTEI